MHSDHDRNLLFGVFAVQLRKVTASQIMAAAGAWATDPSKGLPERLLDDKALTRVDWDIINSFVDLAVNTHGGDAAETLEAFGGNERIQETFYGSIVRSSSGEISVNPMQNPTVLSEPEEPLGVSEIPGRYTRQSEHARGGMGRVLLVHDEYVGRDIALKELLPSLSGSSSASESPYTPARASAQFVHRFLQEARVTGQLEHPSIVPVYELGRRTDGSVYYTMKLVRGESLSHAIKGAASLSERLSLLPHFIDLCQAIAYAHTRGVIHRDIKPHNVMVGEFGETVVIDWGLAKILGKKDIHAQAFDDVVQKVSAGEAPDLAGTAYGEAIGTPCYMPPEQAEGKLELLDERADVYSLGAVLYQILTGHPPFEGASVAAILKQVVTNEWKPVADREPSAPPELIAICEHALGHEPADRYATAKELAQEIERFHSGAIVRSYAYSSAELLARFIRKHRAALTTAATAAVVLLGVLIVSYFQVREERDESLAQKKRADGLRIVAETERDRASEMQTVAETERDRASEMQTVAETARDQATEMQTVAETERDRAEEASERAERQNYYRSIALAEMRIRSGDTEGIKGILESVDPKYRHWEWGYLLNQTQLEDARLVAHAEGLTAFALSSDGEKLATAGREGDLVLWNTSDLSENHRWEEFDERVTSLAFEPITSELALLSGGALFTIESTTNELLERTTLPYREHINLAYHPSGELLYVVTISEAWNLVVYDTQSWEVVAQREFPTVNLHYALSPDGKYVAVCGWDGNVVVMDARTLDPVWEKGHAFHLYGVAFDQSSKKILVGAFSNYHAYDFQDDAESTRVPTGLHEQEVTLLSTHPDGNYYASASDDGKLRIVDAASGAAIGLAKNGDPITYLAYDSDGSYIYTASNRGMIRRWRHDNLIEHERKAYRDFGLAPPVPPNRFVYGGAIGLDTFEPDHGYDITYGFGVAFSPDGEVLASARTPNGLVGVWRGENLDEADTISLSGATDDYEVIERFVLFHPISGELIVPRSRALEFFDVDSKSLTRAIPLPSLPFSADIQENGEQLIVGLTNHQHARVIRLADDSQIELRDSSVGDAILRESLIVAIAPNGLRAATASVNIESIYLWDLPDGNLVSTFLTNGVGVQSIDFHPSRNVLAAGCGDGTIRIFSIPNGESVSVLPGHQGITSSVAFSPDGARLLSSGHDMKARLWDWEAGLPLVTLVNRHYFVVDAAFSPDGTRIAVTDSSPQVVVYNALNWETP